MTDKKVIAVGTRINGRDTYKADAQKLAQAQTQRSARSGKK